VGAGHTGRSVPGTSQNAFVGEFGMDDQISDLGLVLGVTHCNRPLFQGLETTQIIAKVANENLRPPVPQDCPWKDIMVTCWAENPLDRLEFSEIVEAFTALKSKIEKESQST
jgi:hypothetical protein